MNPALTPDERAELLLAQMTEDEQLQLVKGYYGAYSSLPIARQAPPDIQKALPKTAGFVPGIPRLGIPNLIETDAGIGIANHPRFRPGDQAVALPSGIMLAATWNTGLAQAAGATIGIEARDRAFNVVLDGAVNLVRDPRDGRTFEYPGEDPLLAGTIAGSEVSGIQSEHVISTVKHFAFNDQETGRSILSASVREAAARESDLLAFEIAIERGDPGAVMCAYNRYNGVYACQNDFLLNRVLKGDWRFPGWVLSDWGGVHSTVQSANAGLDQESASGFDKTEFFGLPLKQAIAEGQVRPERLHDMVHRILRSLFAKGIFDYPMAKRPSNDDADRMVAQRVAEQGIVLLKNANSILPLATTLHRIAIIGSHANVGVLSGGGSSQVIPIGHSPDNEFYIGGAVQTLANGAQLRPRWVKIYDPPSAVSTVAVRSPQALVQYDDGLDVSAAAALAQRSDVAIVFAEQWMTEGRDVPNLSLPDSQDALISAIAAANPRTIVVLETGGPVLMPWLERVPAVLEAWYSGSGGATAITRVLFGDANPCGKLPLTFPQSESELPRPVIPSGTAPFDVNYLEGADAGYRWFERQNAQPLFAFGYGLSYSTFSVDSVLAEAGPTITVSANVTNTGKMTGMETVEAFVTPPDPSGRAVPRLIGWSKAELKPGETQRVAIAGDPRTFAEFDETHHVWRLIAGDYAVAVGTSSASLTQAAPVHLVDRTLPP